MSNKNATSGLTARVEAVLPYLRRHARALTGSQHAGDDYALATLEAVLTDPGPVLAASSVSAGVFRVFFRVWQEGPKPGPVAEEGLAAKAQAHLRSLTPNSRQALLLRSIEEFSQDEIAEIMGVGTDEIDSLLGAARSEMKQIVLGRIMVIEDEAMIAMDLQEIVSAMGHDVSGAAATRDRAVTLAANDRPDLILSDIQLADGSSGIDAVDEILTAAGDIPVIFITAFPERLLTGDRREPAFVITKPYSEDQVKSAISQAMFFRSSADISL